MVNMEMYVIILIMTFTVAVTLEKLTTVNLNCISIYHKVKLSSGILFFCFGYKLVKGNS